jgi:nucleoside-diphosphate-sugar epimerase
MTTLIFGCGYLGRRVGALLCANGEHVVGTARSPRRAAEITALGIEPVIADVLDVSSLHRLPAAHRVVYCVGFDRSAGLSLHTVYVKGLENVLASLRGPVSRLVYASSTGVYGQTGGVWVDEESPAAPRHESGRVCLEAETRIRTFEARRALGGAGIVLRFAGLYGPERVVRRSSVERGEAIPGNPDRFLNLIHIDDAARAVEAALQTSRTDQLYAIADDQPVTRHDYYSAVASLLGAAQPRFEPPGAGSAGEDRDLSSKRVLNDRMKRRLGVVLQFPDITSGLPQALGLIGKP